MTADKSQKSSFHPSQLKITTPIQADLATKQLNKEFRENVIASLLSANFLVFLITLFVLVAGFVIMIKTNEFEKIIDFWKVILPLITTYVGYAIGKGKSETLSE
jgi:hypothetical protein